ncbi:MAG TPA: caspase family protein, partial [Vicinamibacterales bacterium]|nr:caspase family protein [Vicinamibacterales bacterium]
MTATLAATLALVSTAATAAPRALIMGVGEYARLDADLIGIDVDMEMMTEVAINLGFAEEEIKVLHDAEATYANIEAAMTTWIRDGVTENDHVLIYFSGHGSRVPDADGDEDDGVDEVLLTHDAFLRRDLQPG